MISKMPRVFKTRKTINQAFSSLLAERHNAKPFHTSDQATKTVSKTGSIVSKTSKFINTPFINIIPLNKTRLACVNLLVIIDS